MDDLSRVHYRAVSAEIAGRFFSAEEAAELKQQLNRHIVEDPAIRAAAAQTWNTGNPAQESPQGEDPSK